MTSDNNDTPTGTEDAADVRFHQRVREAATSLLRDIEWQQVEPFLNAATSYIEAMFLQDELGVYITDEGKLQVYLGEGDLEFDIPLERVIRASFCITDGKVSEPDRAELIATLEKALAFARSYNGEPEA